MATKNIIKTTMAVTVGLLLNRADGQAATFHVNINAGVRSIAHAPTGAPFSLDFQFIDGGVLGNNTATISNFTLSGGTATGSAVTLGGALGNIDSTVSFDNSAFFQELYQTFPPLGSPAIMLGFDVSLTENFDGVTPDSFRVGILDSALANIPTNGIGNSLFHVDIAGPITITEANYSVGTGDYFEVAALPEPAIAGFGVGLALVGALTRRRRSMT